MPQPLMRRYQFDCFQKMRTVGFNCEGSSPVWVRPPPNASQNSHQWIQPRLHTNQTTGKGYHQQQVQRVRCWSSRSNGMFPVQHAHCKTVLNIWGLSTRPLRTPPVFRHMSLKEDTENLTQLFSRKRLYDRYQMFGDPMPQQCLPWSVPIHAVKCLRQNQPDNPNGMVCGKCLVNDVD